jgi:hypothetical protein
VEQPVDNAEKEVDGRGNWIAHQKWFNTNFSGNADASARAIEGSAATGKTPLSGRAIAFILLSVALVLLQPFLLMDEGGGDILLAMLRGAAMLVAAFMICSRKLPLVIMGAVLSVLFALGSISSLTGDSSIKGGIGLASLGAAFAIAAYGAPLFKKNETKLSPDQHVYGSQPTEWGRGSSDSSPSSIWVMGNLLNKLVKIPGTDVFHGLKSPGAKWVDVEHAVTHGKNLYLIDSWLSYPMNYNWHPNKKGLAATSKGDDGHRHTRIADAADHYRAILGQSVNVIPVIAIVSGEASIGPDRWSPRGVGLFTANELMEFIGDNAVENLPVWRDNPQVREVVASTVESYG